MKTNVISVESFNAVTSYMKESKKARNLWKAHFCSLSRLLRNAQTKEGLEIVAPIFEKFGIPTNGKVKPAEVEALIANRWYDEKGHNYPAYISRRAVTEKDSEGNKVVKKDSEGNVIYEYVLTPVRDCNWTLDNLCKCLASPKA